MICVTEPTYTGQWINTFLCVKTCHFYWQEWQIRKVGLECFCILNKTEIHDIMAIPALCQTHTYGTLYLLVYSNVDHLLTLSNPDNTLLNARLANIRWNEKAVVRSGCGLNWGNFTEFGWRDQGKPRQIIWIFWPIFEAATSKNKSEIYTYRFRYLVQNLAIVYFLSSSTIILVHYWKEVGVHRDNIKKNHTQKKNSTKPEVRTFLVKMDLDIQNCFQDSKISYIGRYICS